jgi:hypothetical protein
MPARRGGGGPPGRTGPVAWSDNGQLERHVWWGRLAGGRASNFERRLARGGWWPAGVWGEARGGAGGWHPFTTTVTSTSRWGLDVGSGHVRHGCHCQ